MSGYRCSVMLGEGPTSEGRKQRWTSAEESLKSAGSWKFKVSRSRPAGLPPNSPHCDLLERKPQSLTQTWGSASSDSCKQKAEPCTMVGELGKISQRAMPRKREAIHEKR